MLLLRGGGGVPPADPGVGGLSTCPASAAGLCHPGQVPDPLWASVAPTSVQDGERSGLPRAGVCLVLRPGHVPQTGSAHSGSLISSTEVSRWPLPHLLACVRGLHVWDGAWGV